RAMRHHLAGDTPCRALGAAELAKHGRDHRPLHRHGPLPVMKHARDQSSWPSGVRSDPGAAWVASLTRATAGGPALWSRESPTPSEWKTERAPTTSAPIHSGSATGAARGRDAPRARRWRRSGPGA